MIFLNLSGAIRYSLTGPIKERSGDGLVPETVFRRRNSGDEAVPTPFGAGDVAVPTPFVNRPYAVIYKSKTARAASEIRPIPLATRRESPAAACRRAERPTWAGVSASGSFSSN